MGVNYKYSSTSPNTFASNSNIEKSVRFDDSQIPGKLQEINLLRNRLLKEEGELLEKGLQSMDPDVLMKSNAHWADVQKRQPSGLKSQIVDPNEWASSSHGYKTKGFTLSFYTLRRLGRTPIIRSIITTRQAQVSSFSSPQRSRFDTGFVIVKKRKFYTDEDPELTEADKKTVIELTEFLLNGGTDGNTWHGDNFDTFLKKVVEDTLSMDQANFEVVRNRAGMPVEYLAVDPATIRIADSYDDDDYVGERQQERGYYPSYVQVIDGKIINEYYPWEMCFGTRNSTTDIRSNGYGRSELEDLIDIITWMLFGDQYNGRFFSQGAAPKGLLKVSGNVNRNRLMEFRQEWLSMVAGVMNAWKVPMIESDKMEWIDLQKSNTDMQFGKWQEYLIKVACAMYKIAPEEIGFSVGTAGGGGAGLQGEGQNESKLKYSRDKGLKPLLKSIQFWINKYLINPINDEFEFRFAGIDIDSEEKELDLDIKKMTNFAGWKEIRKKWGYDEELEEGDFPLNNVWVQRVGQLEMQQMQEESQAAMEEEGGGENDIWDSLGEEVAKGIPGHEDNPMLKDLVSWYGQNVLSDG